MNGKSLVLASSAGLATFLLVGAGVTIVFEQWIEFSLFVGIPAGLLAGVLAAGGVAFGLATEDPSRQRRIAGTVAGFSVAFLLSLGILVLVWNGGLTVSLGVSIVIGLAGAGFAYVRGRTGKQSNGQPAAAE